MLSDVIGSVSRASAPWIVAVVLLAASPALAQSRGITGVVRDPQQAVVPGAEVILTNARTGARETTVTDGQGRYRFMNLAPDAYLAEVRANGFQVISSQAISLSGGESQTRDFVLALAGAAESVTVTATGGVDRGYRVDAVSSLVRSAPQRSSTRRTRSASCRAS